MRTMETMIGTRAARAQFADAVSALVGTLTAAHALAAEQGDDDRLRVLIQRAREELDTADEKLLMLDRNRERSVFLRSERLRARLGRLHHRLK